MNNRKKMLQIISMLFLAVVPGIFIILAVLTEQWGFVYYGVPISFFAGSAGFLNSKKQQE
ncbi:hypothetical protein [Bacillus marinisedimentorum]|uniref:hypothetical protein n=1 Tax=Bacillus marinisedimentorum TaxID=1821260 RepID=UPI0007E266AC|nr:hypothetical protein [Bacillus marinisedimentorum]